MTNTGTIVKLTGTLTSALRSTVLTNAGVLSTQTGTLNIRTENTTDISGTVKATANAQVTFDGADTLLFDTGDTITGAGTMGVTVPTAELATTPTINGLQAAANAQLVLDHDTTLGTLNLVQNGHLTGPGSVAVTHDMTLAGTVASSGDVTVTPTATLTWDGGDWAGTGTTTLATGSSTVLTGGSIHGRSLTTAGTVDFQTGILTTTHGAIDNTGAWTFDQTGDTPPAQLNDDGQTGGFRFVNEPSGSVVVSGGSAGVPAELDGWAGGGGSLSLSGGVLRMRPAGGVAAVLPDVVVPAGGALDLGGFTLQDPVGSFVVPAGGSISGGGSVVVSVAGSVEVDGLVSARSVQVAQVGLVDGSGSVVVNGGTFGLGGSILGSVSTELKAGTDGTWFRGSALLGRRGSRRSMRVRPWFRRTGRGSRSRAGPWSTTGRWSSLVARSPAALGRSAITLIG